MSDKERSNLLDDVLNIARAGQLPYNVALGMTLYLDAEEDLLPWDSAEAGFRYISDMMFWSANYSLWQVVIAQPIVALDVISDSMRHKGRSGSGKIKTIRNAKRNNGDTFCFFRIM